VTVLSDMQAAALATLVDLGTTCSVTDPNGEWATDGSVTETAVTYASVTCSDLLDESQRYVPDGTGRMASGTFYLPSDIDFTPAIGYRVTYRSRTYAVVAVFPYRVQGGIVAWRLDVADQGAA
jgi:hypothetical protein